MNGIIDVPLSPTDGLPVVPEEIKQRVRNGESVTIHIRCGSGYVNNALTHGVAGLNIDGARIGVSGSDNIHAKNPHTKGGFGHGEAQVYGDSSGAPKYNAKQGRWPANVILQHDERCVCVGEVDDKGYVINRFKDGAKPFGDGAGHEYETEKIEGGKRELWACVPGCPVRMLDDQVGTRKSGKRRKGARKSSDNWSGHFSGDGGPAIGGSAGPPSRFFYCSKVSSKERNTGLPEGKKNKHPTVKPVALLEYLCRLTATPTGGVVLDPFMGSGSTGVACVRMGRQFIGIDDDSEPGSCEIAELRIQAAGVGDEKKKRGS